MTSHRRSLSESFVLEDNDKQYVRVSGINPEEHQEGDETVGAMKNDVIDILKLIEPYNDKIQVLSKPGLRSSKSLGNLDNRIKAPDELRKDSYNKLFNAKVKRFIKGNRQGKSQEDVSNSLTGQLRLGRTNAPDTDLKGPRLEGKLEKSNLPSFIRPDIDVKGDFTGPEFSLSSPKMDAGHSHHDIYINGLTNDLKTGHPIPNVDLPSGNVNTSRFKMPDFGLSAHKIRSPDIELSHPKIKGELNSPEITTPDLNAHTLDRIKVPNLQKQHFNFEVPDGDIDTSGLSSDIKAPDLNIDTPSGKLKMPKFGLSGHLPKGEVDDQDIKLTLPKADLKAPKLNVNSSDIDIDNTTGKFKMPKLKTPKFNLPSFKGPDTDVTGDLERPDLSWSSHKFDADLDLPHTYTDGPKADLKDVTLPNMDLPSGKSKMPKFKMPDFGPSISNVKSPEMDLSLPKMKGQINSPNLTTPELDIDVPTGKIKGPTIKEPKADITAPEFNIDAPSGKLKMPNFKGPNIKGDLGSPDMNLAFPEADVKGPKLDVKSPDIDIDGPTGKFKMPKGKTPKFSLTGFKGPDTDVTENLERPDLSWSSPNFDADVDVPDIDIDGPKADFKGMTRPNMDLPSGKSKMPKFKMPDFGHSIPNVKAPEMDLSLPKMKGEINSPNLTVPELDIDVPTGKIKGPTLKAPKADIRAPKFNIDAPSGKLKMPNFKGPNIKGDLGSPDMNLAFPEADVKGPKLDVKSPDIDIDSPTGKFKMPKGKTPKFSLPGFKGPDTDVTGNLERPDLSWSSPNFDADVDVPNIDIDGPKADFKGMTRPNMDLPSGKSKMPKFKMPDFGHSVPNVKAPEMDLSLPKMKGEINSPNLTVPELDIDVPTGKIKGPTLKAPKADIRAPKFNINAPSGKLKMPNFKGPNIKGDLGSPDMNLAFPEADVKGPKLDVKSPDIDIDSPTGKFKMPKMKTPKFSIPGFQGPGLDGKGDLKGPDLSVSSPKFDADIAGPDLDIHGPKANINDMTLPNMHLPSGKTKMPKFKLPGFGLSGSKVKAPEMDLSLPKMKGEINSPNLTVPELDVNVPTSKIKGPTLKEPKADIRAPEFNIDASSGKLKMPNFKGPNIKGDLGSPDMNLAFPEADVKGPKLDVKSPDIDIGGPTGKIKMPKMKTPKFTIPGFKGPDIDAKGDLKGPDLSMSSSKFDADVTGPDLDIDGPKANVNGVTLPDVHVPSGVLLDSDLVTGKATKEH
ncbi:hypothetical protein PGIGA_G00029430 [Pangasianodon gigas]|uniref:Uncharacterized protein n=1 Tax=Pangasianodon gigas TaxID=30993 RepID=A0ACC5WXE9_PANGG|nr:hypothetical protein [Pangasianodon gigas]